MAEHEEVAIVDENDRIVGYKLRSDLLASDRIRISAIWIENNQDEVLIAQRAHSRIVDPGCWGPAAAGTVQKNHAYEETAYRELFEEIGLHATALTQLQKETYINSRGRARVCQWFGLKWNGAISELSLQTEEVAAIKWINKKQLSYEIKNHPGQFVASAVVWPKLFNL